MKKTLLLLASLSLGASCAPKIKTNISKKYAPLDYRQEVMVLEMDETTPADLEVLGTVKVGDAGVTTQCNYAQVLTRAKEEARKYGGNIIKITQHRLPDLMTTCHRIKAEVLRADAKELALLKTADEEIDSTLDHAVLYVYRGQGTGTLLSYNLYLGDSTICKVSNRFRQKIKVYKSGETELWAKTESKAAVPVHLEKGKSYYLRCSVAMGVMVGRPNLELVSNRTGSREFLAH